MSQDAAAKTGQHSTLAVALIRCLRKQLFSNVTYFSSYHNSISQLNKLNRCFFSPTFGAVLEFCHVLRQLTNDSPERNNNSLCFSQNHRWVRQVLASPFPSPIGGSGSGDFLEMLHMKQLDSRANFGEEKHTHFHNISCIERNRFCFNEP